MSNHDDLIITPASDIPVEAWPEIPEVTHRCRRNHRTYNAFAECAWPLNAWVSGEGRYATVAYCGTVTVSLHKTLDGALKAKNLIDRIRCGHRCHNAHVAVELAIEEQR